MGTIGAENTVCLAIAAVMGGIVGWLLRTITMRRRGRVDAAARLAEKDREVEGIQAQIDACIEEKILTTAEHVKRVKELTEHYEKGLKEKNEEIARLKTLSGDKTQPKARKKAAVPHEKMHPDDLTLINGVGPKLQKLLNSLGVRTFKHVAMWTKEDIDRIDAKLVHFHGKIRKEGWVKSAKALHFKKYGVRL